MTMNFRTWVAVFGLFCSNILVCAYAQASRPADSIVAVVNSEPVTQSEVRAAVQRVARDMAQQRVAAPPAEELQRRVLERLINERAQLQHARETGIRVDELALDQAEQNVARQNQIDVTELRLRVAKDGINPAQFRSQLRDQLILSRLHERDVEGRLRISEADIDAAIAEQQTGQTDPLAQEINLANLLVSVPESATTEQATQRMLQAQKALERIRAGEDFAALVNELSAGDRANGGQLGLRRADRYPPSFVAATQNLAAGGVSEIIRSGAGFHILKVIEKNAPPAPVKAMVQTHARHILLRAGPQLSQAAAVAQTANFKKRIETGAITFAALAREHSQDGSAPQGGDLGWVGAGAFVPEFEEPMNRLADGQISEPVVSRFGVHLIQVIERRRAELSEREVREGIRAQIKGSRYDAAFTSWAEEIRANAFVELRQPAQ
jgi:peptidyl-prolyl cis-trans isomerase SurA